MFNASAGTGAPMIPPPTTSTGPFPTTFLLMLDSFWKVWIPDSTFSTSAFRVSVTLLRSKPSWEVQRYKKSAAVNKPFFGRSPFLITQHITYP